MGVTNLWTILEPVKKHTPLTDLKGKVLAVDLSIWVCENQSVKQMHGVVVKPHLRNLFFRVSYLTLLGVKLVFVEEGEAPELKWEEMWRRQQARGLVKPGSGFKPVKRKRSQFAACLKECCELLDLLGIPHIKGRGEAEAMCAALNAVGLVDGCITDDGDAFLYGAQTIYRNFTMNSKDPHVERYKMSDIEDELSINRNSLVGLSLLLGCDYLPGGVPGVGVANAVKLLKCLLGKDTIQRFKDWRKMSVSQCKDKIEQSIREKSLKQPDFPQQQIIDEFLSDKERIPSKSFQWKKANISASQEFGLRKLEWPIEYTLEKVLPLVTLWSQLDLTRNGPSDKQLHPHRIVKSRVRHFVPSYEVEWNKDVWDKTSTCDYYTTIEEQTLFTTCYPHLVSDYTDIANNKKTKKKVSKKKPNKEIEDLSTKMAAASIGNDCNGQINETPIPQPITVHNVKTSDTLIPHIVSSLDVKISDNTMPESVPYHDVGSYASSLLTQIAQTVGTESVRKSNVEMDKPKENILKSSLSKKRENAKIAKKSSQLTENQKLSAKNNSTGNVSSTCTISPLDELLGSEPVSAADDDVFVPLSVRIKQRQARNKLNSEENTDRVDLIRSGVDKQKSETILKPTNLTTSDIGRFTSVKPKIHKKSDLNLKLEKTVSTAASYNTDIKAQTVSMSGIQSPPQMVKVSSSKLGSAPQLLSNFCNEIKDCPKTSLNCRRDNVNLAFAVLDNIGSDSFLEDNQLSPPPSHLKLDSCVLQVLGNSANDNIDNNCDIITKSVINSGNEKIKTCGTFSAVMCSDSDKEELSTENYSKSKKEPSKPSRQPKGRLKSANSRTVKSEDTNTNNMLLSRENISQKTKKKKRNKSVKKNILNLEDSIAEEHFKTETKNLSKSPELEKPGSSDFQIFTDENRILNLDKIPNQSVAVTPLKQSMKSSEFESCQIFSEIPNIDDLIDDVLTPSMKNLSVISSPTSLRDKPVLLAEGNLAKTLLYSAVKNSYRKMSTPHQAMDRTQTPRIGNSNVFSDLSFGNFNIQSSLLNSLLHASCSESPSHITDVLDAGIGLNEGQSSKFTKLECVVNQGQISDLNFNSSEDPIGKKVTCDVDFVSSPSSYGIFVNDSLTFSPLTPAMQHVKATESDVKDVKMSLNFNQSPMKTLDLVENPFVSLKSVIPACPNDNPHPSPAFLHPSPAPPLSLKDRLKLRLTKTEVNVLKDISNL